jgi:hypothetical protein
MRTVHSSATTTTSSVEPPRTARCSCFHFSILDVSTLDQDRCHLHSNGARVAEMGMPFAYPARGSKKNTVYETRPSRTESVSVCLSVALGHPVHTHTHTAPYHHTITGTR